MAQNSRLQKLLEIVEEYPQESYNQIIAKQKDWMMLYHLSELRRNVVEWLPIRTGENVLEIGSGCGALTGLFAGRAKCVVGIEANRELNHINEVRCRENQNVSLHCGNYEQIKPMLTEKFDWVIAVDNFMESAGEQKQENYLSEFLKSVTDHLKPEGHIVLALPNRLGMKYFSGCAEAKTGKFFEGIEGYLSTDTVFSYSKTELIEQIETAGEYDMEFYYPYPDHIFAMSIYSDEYLPKLGELRTNHNNFDRARLELFDETEAFDGVIKSGLFPQFANSFLVVLTWRGKHE
ncbi:MAG: class I SAM-dependent methyltransferase [Eubacteriales bacterium]|nr:class I SAM-dependent methyltransferase [Eubacteriales bacterium]